MISIKRQMIYSILSWLMLHVSTVDIQMDPAMTEDRSSYIYCHVGSVTAGVNFYTEPATAIGGCLGPGSGCSAPPYIVEYNSTGVSLVIDPVVVSRDKGIWYCQHGSDRSTNTISLNNYTIAGFLLKTYWTEPSGLLKEFIALMTLSCTNQIPIVSFSYEDSESITGTVPPEAVSMATMSSYEGTTCENGNKFYVIRLTASNNLGAFNNKKNVTFSFTYYGNLLPLGVSAGFEAFQAFQVVSVGLEVFEIVLIVVVVVLLFAVVLVLIYCCWKKKKFCFKEKEDKSTTKNNTSAMRKNNGENGPEPPMDMTPK